MNDPRVVLHIGTYKTGTTAIQKHLHGLRATLRASGVLYPDTGVPAESSLHGHHELAAVFWSLSPDAARVEAQYGALRAEIASSGADTVLISSEQFCSVNDPRHLAAALGLRRIEIVISLRPQDELLNALYYTSLVGAHHVLSPDEYAEGPVDAILDYHALIGRWRSAFPAASIRVRVYEKGLSPRTNAAVDFIRVLGLEGRVPLPTGRTTVHRTLPARATFMLRTLIAARVLSPEEFFTVFQAVHAVYANTDMERSCYAPSFRRALMERVAASNRAVRRDYLDGRDEDLFRPTTLPDEDTWRASVGDATGAVARCMLDAARHILRRQTAAAKEAAE